MYLKRKQKKNRTSENTTNMEKIPKSLNHIEFQIEDLKNGVIQRYSHLSEEEMVFTPVITLQGLPQEERSLC